MLQAILDCAQALFDHYDENRDVWMTIRSHCGDLFGTEDLSLLQLYPIEPFGVSEGEFPLSLMMGMTGLPASACSV